MFNGGASGYMPARGGHSRLDENLLAEGNNAGDGKGGMRLGSDMPFVCETCLGPNPYVRMIKMQFGSKECKISSRPFQAFRWRAGPGGRHKETIVSYEVARQKNVCQACLVDMAYGLPVAVRDSLLGSAGQGGALDSQMSRPNADYFWQEKNRDFERASEGGLAIGGSSGGMNPSQQLLQLSRALNSRGSKAGVSFRNLPKMCSFWLKGACTRVLSGTCPFRPCCGIFKFPELASDYPDECQLLIGQLTADGPGEIMKSLDSNLRQLLMDSQKGSKDQAIRDRYYGVKDNLANKYLARASSMQLEAPDDQTVTALWIGGLTPAILKEDLHDKFYSFGELRNINVVTSQKCAFVEFTGRSAAERAASELHKNLNIKGVRLQLSWARPAKKADGQSGGRALTAGGESNSTPAGGGGGNSAAMPPPPGMQPGQSLPPPPPGLIPPAKRQKTQGTVPPPPPPGPPPAMGRNKPSYPSMNPERLGSRHSTT